MTTALDDVVDQLITENKNNLALRLRADVNRSLDIQPSLDKMKEFFKNILFADILALRNLNKLQEFIQRYDFMKKQKDQTETILGRLYTQYYNENILQGMNINTSLFEIKNILQYLVNSGYFDYYTWRKHLILSDKSSIGQQFKPFYDYIDELLKDRELFLKETKEIVSQILLEDISKLIVEYL